MDNYPTANDLEDEGFYDDPEEYWSAEFEFGRRIRSNYLCRVWPAVVEYLDGLDWTWEQADGDFVFIPKPIEVITFYDDNSPVVLCEDGSIIKFEYNCESGGGTYDEPPWTDEWVEWGYVR